MNLQDAEISLKRFLEVRSCVMVMYLMVMALDARNKVTEECPLTL